MTLYLATYNGEFLLDENGDFVLADDIENCDKCCEAVSECVCNCTRFTEIYSQTDPVISLCLSITLPASCGGATTTHNMNISGPPAGYDGCEAFVTADLDSLPGWEVGAQIYAVCEDNTIRIIAIRGDGSSNCHFAEVGVIDTLQCTGTFSATGTLGIIGHAPLGACSCDGENATWSLAEGACP